MKHRIKEKIVHTHMDEDGIEKIRHMQEKKAENDEKLIFNDAPIPDNFRIVHES